jgi:hypothetical protein
MGNQENALPGVASRSAQIDNQQAKYTTEYSEMLAAVRSDGGAK